MTRALVVAAVALVGLTLVVACPPQNLPREIPPPPAPGPGYEPPVSTDHPIMTGSGTGSGSGSAVAITGGAANGAACSVGPDCASGLCEGPGCGAGQGVCAPRDRACTYDIRSYCGCDGVTFDASGSCAERRYAHRGACTAAGSGSAAAGPLPTGASCLQASECESGICEGQGCGDGTPGVCAGKARRCTRDNRAYCGCDRVTFHASGSCPGKRYAAAGACPAP